MFSVHQRPMRYNETNTAIMRTLRTSTAFQVRLIATRAFSRCAPGPLSLALGNCGCGPGTPIGYKMRLHDDICCFGTPPTHFIGGISRPSQVVWLWSIPNRLMSKRGSRLSRGVRSRGRTYVLLGGMVLGRIVTAPRASLRLRLKLGRW